MPPAVAEKRTQLEREADRLLDISDEYDPDQKITFTARVQDIYIGSEATARVREWCAGTVNPQAMRDLGQRIEAASK